MFNIEEHLQRTSRTFALAIPLLPEPTRRKISLAYLLFRVADTLEDGERWTPAGRVQALRDFRSALAQPARAEEFAARWTQSPPTTHEGYVALLAGFPALAAAITELDGPSCDILLTHAARTAEGMEQTLLRAPEGRVVELANLAELQRYCYYVAGIVGELLTALFLHDAPELRPVRDVLLEHQVAFGEGLQLVNILKDRANDAADGRVFLPPTLDPAEVLDVARRDMQRARVYVEAMRRVKAPAGFVAFVDLCATLAVATLDALEQRGPGAKVSRSDVQHIYANVVASSSPAPGLASHSPSAQSGK